MKPRGQAARVGLLEERLRQIEAVLPLLLAAAKNDAGPEPASASDHAKPDNAPAQPPPEGGSVLSKDWYTTKEVAGIVGRSHFQVRKWCRERRVRFESRPVRGRHGQHFIPKDEVERLLRTNCELLPIPKERRYRYRA